MATFYVCFWFMTVGFLLILSFDSISLVIFEKVPFEYFGKGMLPERRRSSI